VAGRLRGSFPSTLRRCALLGLSWSYDNNLTATLENYHFVLSYPIFIDAVKTSVVLATKAFNQMSRERNHRGGRTDLYSGTSRISPI
jgi:hypothetical protein